MFIVICPYFGWIIRHGVEGSKFNVVDVTDRIPSNEQRGLYEEINLVYQSVLIRWYHFLVP